MPTFPSILPPDGDLASLPSMPTLHGGDPNTLGRIDHYDLLRKLGGGGFGVVYLARDSVSGIEVALKTLHPLLKTNAEEMDALREKFRLVHGLTHPNIAKALVLHPVRDLNIWDETVCKEMRLSPGDSVMVMDYAPGVTLSRWRRQFPDGIVPLDLALETARQLASALDYAHGERIVHRDIKPGNIMVETLGPLTGFQDGQEEQDAPGVALAGQGSPVNPANRVHPVSKLRVRLLDFGLAAEIRSSMSRVSTETGDTSGTRPYMAPEQWLGKKQDGRTDQYALACVLYERLSGAPPFAGVFETGDPMIMMATIKSETPGEIENVPEAVNAALLRALAKTPKERFVSCSEFVTNCLTQRPRSSQGMSIIPRVVGDAGFHPSEKSHVESAKPTHGVRTQNETPLKGVSNVEFGFSRSRNEDRLFRGDDDLYRPHLTSWGTILLSAFSVLLALVLVFGIRHRMQKQVAQTVLFPTATLPVSGQKPQTPTTPTQQTYSRHTQQTAVPPTRPLDVPSGGLVAERTKLMAQLASAPVDRRPEIEARLGAVNVAIATTAVPSPGKIELTVAPGDSLVQIAVKYACPVKLIQAINGLKGPNIRAGSKLVVLDHPKFEITVSRKTNTLLLTLNGEFFKRYSVCTAANGKTPLGTFEITEKEENPVWYPDGKTAIPSGQPGNILGTRWMSLEATGSTPRVRGVGIHGTTDPACIGHSASDGSIRMHNADVEEIFRMIPLHVPVTIVE